MVTQPVIEEIALPRDSQFPSDVFLPIRDGDLHTRIARECDDAVEVVRHEQQEAAVPDELFMVVGGRGQHAITNPRTAQMVPVPWLAIDGDEEEAGFSDSLRDLVTQTAPNGQVHGTNYE